MQGQGQVEPEAEPEPRAGQSHVDDDCRIRCQDCNKVFCRHNPREPFHSRVTCAENTALKQLYEEWSRPGGFRESYVKGVTGLRRAKLRLEREIESVKAQIANIDATE